MPKKLKQNDKRILIATGGTGGHVFPAIALAHHLHEDGFKVQVVVDKRGEVYLKNNLHDIPYTRLQEKNLGSGGLAKRFIALIPSCIKAIRFLRKNRPSKVVSFGGYPCFPICVAATFLKIPLYMHEQNATIGKVTRLFLPLCKNLFLSFPNTHGLSSKYATKTIACGNFVRKAFHDIKNTYPLTKADKPLNILVFGGSQGAATVARLTLDAVNDLPEGLKDRIELTVQAPEKSMDELQSIWPATSSKTPLHKLQGTMKPFFDDMPAQLAKAHLVISRSGASTIWELLAAKRPSVLLPLPTAADNHQYYNANFLVETNCAWRISGQDVTARNLRNLLNMILSSPELLLGHYSNIRSLSEKVFKKNPLEIMSKILQS